MKAVVAAFNQEKALVGAISVITNLRMDLFEALICSLYCVLSSPRSSCGVVAIVMVISLSAGSGHSSSLLTGGGVR